MSETLPRAVARLPETRGALIRPVLTPQTFDQLVIFAEMAAATDMVPKDFRNKPGNIMVAVQMGSELGLSPMQSLNSIAVINGRPGVWGDGLIGLCRQSSLCQDIVETIEGDGDAREAVCIATRRGATPTTGRFSVADAKKAGLWGKDIWLKYPDRMLQNRARGFALRDAFPDLLRGLRTVEELRDTPPDDYRGVTLDARPEPTKPRPTAPASAAREAINAEVPIKPRRTGRDVIEEIRAQLANAGSLTDVDAIAASDLVEKALGWLKNGALVELNALLADAFARFAGIDGDEQSESAEDQDGTIFPGDLPVTDEMRAAADAQRTGGQP